jgi:hypothetical protein
LRRSGAAAIGLIAILSGTAAAQDARPARQVHHVLESPALPRVRVRVSPELAYLGAVRYEVPTGALVEAFVFGDTADGTLLRAFVAHFEGYPAGVDRSFDYPRLEMARLGAHEYLHQTWALRQFGLFGIQAMREFLAARGIAAGPSWVMDRYVRTVDPEQRHEVIFFYLESSAMHDPAMKFGGAPDPPPPPVPPPAVLEAVRARAAQAFQVVSEAE